MSNVDAFSWAVKKGFNALTQVSEVHSVSNGEELRAIVAEFSFQRTANKNVEIETFGARTIDEGNIPNLIAAHKKNGLNPANLQMINQAAAVFERIRAENTPLDKINELLKENTEIFFQTYIAGRTITQTFNPVWHYFLPDTPENPDDKFLHKRNLQMLDEKIGKTAEVDHENIRRTWGLD